jgi:exportin-2 (importin alpha re-exporter)
MWAPLSLLTGLSETDQSGVIAVMRVIITSRQALTPSYATILSHLTKIVLEISKNPSNPKFNHYTFESISALVRYV